MQNEGSNSFQQKIAYEKKPGYGSKFAYSPA